jgi:hypothetical protein
VSKLYCGYIGASLLHAVQCYIPLYYRPLMLSQNHPQFHIHGGFQVLGFRSFSLFRPSSNARNSVSRVT